jgi:tRNA nucleotidyltransferase (CCA-adding enzyme)
MKNQKFDEVKPEDQAPFPQNDEFNQWYFWASKTEHPSRLLAYLKETQRLTYYSELAALEGVPQEPQFHPEGDAFTHTGLVMDAAAEIARREHLEEQQRSLLILASLTHDFGKATMTRTIMKNDKPYISSAGHEKASGPLAGAFLRRIGADEDTVASIVALVENHMAHVDYLHGADEADAVSLAKLIAPADIQMLAYLIEADTSGRPPLPKGLPPGGIKLVDIAQSAGVLHGLGT